MPTTRFSRIPFIFVCCLLGALSLNSNAEGIHRHHPMAKQKVVFQVSDNSPGKWNLTLNNALNFQREFGARRSAIEVVAYGPGIGMLKFGSPVEGRVVNAMHRGIRFEACKNTMRHKKLTPKDMIAHIGYVPSGVGELVIKERQGYAYIRP